MKYVIICSICGHKNPETVIICQGSGCDAFLSDMEPVPDIGGAETWEQQPSNGKQYTADNDQVKQTDANGHTKTSRFNPEPQVVLTIEYGGRAYEISSGTVMGKDHPESSATLKIPGLPDYIHRQHCIFNFQSGQWTVTAIQNPEFTNPTYVNATKVQPSLSHILRNGDRLTLCDKTFIVRIL